MNDEPNFRAASEAIASVLDKTSIYEDALQPGARQVGTALETLGKIINVLLSPLKAIVYGYEQLEKEFFPLVADRLRNIGRDRLVTPKLTVAGPTVEGLRYTGHEPTLRDMYVNLLATAMDRDTAERAHPGFAEVIRQLTPDEAKILHYLVSTRDVSYEVPEEQDQDAKIKLIGIPANCEHLDLLSVYLDNLQRLRLTWSSPMIASDGFQRIIRGSVTVTCWGRQFHSACMVPKTEASHAAGVKARP